MDSRPIGSAIFLLYHQGHGEFRGGRSLGIIVSGIEVVFLCYPASPEAGFNLHFHPSGGSYLNKCFDKAVLLLTAVSAEVFAESMIVLLFQKADVEI